ncbi:MAG TPA: HD domain-containing phosphohydrolase [Fimbriimonadaceae bacterium]|nr:HD domain-containing phosphohydrolase [Fimbriimonadaceae bacterium]
MGTLLYHIVEDVLGLLIGAVFVYWLVRTALGKTAMIEDRLRTSRRRYRAFIVNSSEAIWRTKCDPPIPIDVGEDEHIELAYRNAYIAECNDAFAAMHGRRKGYELQGKALREFVPRSPEHDETIRSFVRSGFRVIEAESSFVDDKGDTHYFLNNLWAEPIDGMIHDVWGTRRDITIHRRAEEEIKRSMKRLTVLRGIDQAILQNSTVEETLVAVLRTISVSLSMSASAITIFQDDLPWTFSCCKTLEIDSRARKLRVRAMREQCTIVAKERAPWAFKDEMPLCGYVILPVSVKREVVGFLEFFYPEPVVVNDDRRQFYEIVAGQVAIAYEDASLYENVGRAHQELKIAYDATLEGWVKAVDLRDKETEGHTQRVTALTVDLARMMKLPEEEIDEIRRGALLHDVGKVGIPDRILHKPGSLTDEEREVMNRHPVYAFEWLNRIKYLEKALEIPYCHHEKWDGSGYPRGLCGEEIPLSARLFAVVDVYDALTSARPYRPALSHATAMDMIRNDAGTHFDPYVVEMFNLLMHAKAELPEAA